MYSLAMEKWVRLQERINAVNALYDEGYCAEAIWYMKLIWREFQIQFSSFEKRQQLEGGFQEDMMVLLDRIYDALDEKENEQEMLNFCQSICRFFMPEELWLGEYACCVGRILQNQGRSDECDDWFQMWQQEMPKTPMFTANWALCLQERGEEEKAARLLDQTMLEFATCNYQTLEFYLLAWLIYIKMGEIEKADLCSCRIRQLDPDIVLEMDDMYS